MRARPKEPLATWCDARLDGICTGRATCRHHKRRRSQGGTDDATNTADLCNACHDYIHSFPEWSFKAGWLQHAWAS